MIGKDWTKLASLLDFMEDIDIIDSENDSLFDKARVVLTKWKKNLGEKATVKRLIQVLEELGRQDIIDKIEINKE